MPYENDEVRASFRLGSEGLEPEKITFLLGLQPSHCHSAGDRRILKRGPQAGKSIPYKTGVWLLNSELSPSAGVEDHLPWLLDRLEPIRSKIEDLIASGMDADFFVSLSLQSGQFGFDLSPQLMRRIADLGAGLAVTI